MAVQETSRRDSFVVALGSGVSRAFGLISTVAIAYLLSAELFGVLAFAQSTAALVAGLGGLALPSVITRDVGQKPESARGVFLAALSLVVTAVLAVGLLLLLVVTAVGSARLPREAVEIGIPALAMGVLVSALGQGIFSLSVAVVLARRSFRGWVLVNVGQAFCVAVVGTAAATSSSAGVTLVAISLAQLMSGAAAAVFVCRRHLSGDSEPLLPVAQRLLLIAVGPGIASQLISSASWVGLALLAAQEDGLVQVAWFSIATRLATGLAFLPSAVVTAHTPSIHLAAPAGRLRLVGTRAMVEALAMGAIVGLVLVAVAPLVSNLGSSYAGAEWTVRIAALTIPLMAANSLTGIVALARHQHRLWALSDVVLAVALISSASFLVSLGSIGLTFAYCLAYTLSIVFLAWGLLLTGGRQTRTRSGKYSDFL